MFLFLKKIVVFLCEVKLSFIHVDVTGKISGEFFVTSEVDSHFPLSCRAMRYCKFTINMAVVIYITFCKSTVQ